MDAVPPNRDPGERDAVPKRRRLRTFLSRPGALFRLRRLDRMRARGDSPVTFGNAVRVMTSGREGFDAMLAAIEGAERAVAVEMYTWADDRLGGRLAEAVAARARAGVPAYVLLDAFGRLGSDALAARLAGAGAEVRWYHPLAPWTPAWYPNQRNHRKLVLVDGRVGFVGGLNFAEAYSETFAGDAAWKDLAVEVRGPAVAEMTRAFVGSWIRSGGRAEAAGSLAGTPHRAGAAAVQVLGGKGLRGRRALRRGLQDLLVSARSRIFIANAYFAPETFVLRALRRAASRGVSVDLLLPGETDVPMVRWAGRAVYGRLLDAGVRIREHGGSILHAKVLVVDGETLVTGSANLDYRSFRHNQEIAVNVIDRDAASAALAAFEAPFESAAPVDPAAWDERGWRERALERMAWAVRDWL